MNIRGLSTFTAEEDADVDIVRVAIEKLDASRVIVDGSDTDLLILLVALTPENKEIYFFKPSRNKDNYTKSYYNIERLVSSYGEKNSSSFCSCNNRLRHNILLLWCR